MGPLELPGQAKGRPANARCTVDRTSTSTMTGLSPESGLHEFLARALSAFQDRESPLSGDTAASLLHRSLLLLGPGILNLSRVQWRAGARPTPTGPGQERRSNYYSSRSSWLEAPLLKARRSFILQYQ